MGRRPGRHGRLELRAVRAHVARRKAVGAKPLVRRARAGVGAVLRVAAVETAVKLHDDSAFRGVQVVVVPSARRRRRRRRCGRLGLCGLGPVERPPCVRGRLEGAHLVCERLDLRSVIAAGRLGGAEAGNVPVAVAVERERLVGRVSDSFEALFELRGPQLGPQAT